MPGAVSRTRLVGWWIFVLDAPPRGREHELADRLRALGARGLAREGARVVARFPVTERATLDALTAGVGEAVIAVGAPHGAVSAPVWQSFEAWRQERGEAAGGARRVGRRFVVAPAAPAATASPLPMSPTHMDRSLPAYTGGALVIRLVPGLAFGAGEHPTTAACLALLEGRSVLGGRMLDVGTGSGVLAIAAGHLGAAHVVAVEADPFAADEASENVRLNGLEDHVEIVERRLVPGAAPPGAPFDGVVANLEGERLLPLLPAFGAALRPGGWLIVAGLLRDERAAALSALAEAGVTEMLDERVDGGWWSAALGRPPPPPAF